MNRRPATASAAVLALGLSLVGLRVAGASAAAPEPSPVPGTIAGSAPNADNTGVPAGARLRVHHGDLFIDAPGTVITNLDIRGNVVVKASNVTIRNSIIRSRSTTSTTNTGLITVRPGFLNLRVVDTTIIPTKAQVNLTGIYAQQAFLDRVEIANVVDSVHIIGDNVTVVNSWLHDNSYFLNDPYQGGTPTHTDSIQIVAGKNHRIANNSISGAANAAVQVTQVVGVVADVTIENNDIEGGACSINITQRQSGKTASQSPPIQGTIVRNNLFGASSLMVPGDPSRNCNLIVDSTTLSVSTIHGNARTDEGTVTYKERVV